MEEGSPLVFCVCSWNDAVTAVQLSSNIIFGSVVLTVTYITASVSASALHKVQKVWRWADVQLSERATHCFTLFLLPVSLQSVKIFSRWTFQVPHWWRARPVLSHLSPGNNTPLHPPGQRSRQSANQDARQEQEAERTPQIKRRSLTADGRLPVLILTLHCRLSLWLLLHRL